MLPGLDSPKKEEPFEFVKLVSCDGHEFFCDKHVAMQCELFKKMCESELSEGQNSELSFQVEGKPAITGRLLEKVIEYLYWKFKYTDCKKWPPPDFPIEDDLVMDLTLVAGYLDC
uniref:Elongin-C n=1 Tax=Chromera velia CCMP2878 TaxID=1169474 RepID=A0A0G4H5Y1_9ALVE|mmetsp:Transcript_43050/g.84886  ORF Transcript_43050/g.84886 Transcript_43050/m.84886 type:complete len:115 (-) Transcript_43050:304-648(-)|eukprot:Cvel_24779.t1-p1 / transcript=Cvel_24779.t1 / gene=Cvel_24779 / organism=Chromera_velia_CCMP2878 / gene_product=Transcription elongation factor B polypeptide 1, putative / transcript_product=Transcription elongation factor B polypeptide 1, putative / location=Cvel_scaffold2725:15042-17576(+) / protein_length=114 / sequence_SO=supercontig / SO=protein_coding / is_pseudo=false